MSHLQLHSRAEQLVNFLEKTVGTFNPHLVHNSSLHAFPRRIVLPKKVAFVLEDAQNNSTKEWCQQVNEETFLSRCHTRVAT